MNGTFVERMNAKESAKVAVYDMADMREAVLARGTYHATCTAPRARDLKAFLRERDKLVHLERSARVRGLRSDQRIARFAMVSEQENVLKNFDQITVWQDEAPNTVATLGKNLALDTFLAGSSYTVTGPYMGLISSTSWSATAAADTMSSHAGWLEAGNANTPTYTSPRKTAAWSAAGSGAKALSAALSFAATGSGTIKGCFIVYGSGAVTTIDNTSGTLLSAGVFSGGDQPVVSGNTVNVSYTLTL